MRRLITALEIGMLMFLFTSEAKSQGVTQTSPWGAWAWGPGGVWSDGGLVASSPFTPTPIYPASSGGSWGAPYVPPYSYYAAPYPYPARIYVSHMSNDMPFYGTPYGHPYDLWTWPEMRRVAYYIVP